VDHDARDVVLAPLAGEVVAARRTRVLRRDGLAGAGLQPVAEPVLVDDALRARNTEMIVNAPSASAPVRIASFAPSSSIAGNPLTPAATNTGRLIGWGCAAALLRGPRSGHVATAAPSASESWLASSQSSSPGRSAGENTSIAACAVRSAASVTRTIACPETSGAR
jgi:hypothetical protein